MEVYRLLNVYITMERSTIFHGTNHYKWWFSIVMLNYEYQRVNISNWENVENPMGVWGITHFQTKPSNLHIHQTHIQTQLMVLGSANNSPFLDERVWWILHF
jgi:hypothetical protein